MQAVDEVQDTPRGRACRPAGLPEVGVGVDCMAQVVPFHRSARVFTFLPLRVLASPVAVHCDRPVQDTPTRAAPLKPNCSRRRPCGPAGSSRGPRPPWPGPRGEPPGGPGCQPGHAPATGRAPGQRGRGRVPRGPSGLCGCPAAARRVRPPSPAAQRARPLSSRVFLLALPCIPPLDRPPGVTSNTSITTQRPAVYSLQRIRIAAASAVLGPPLRVGGGASPPAGPGCRPGPAVPPGRGTVPGRGGRDPGRKLPIGRMSEASRDPPLAAVPQRHDHVARVARRTLAAGVAPGPAGPGPSEEVFVVVRIVIGLVLTVAAFALAGRRLWWLARVGRSGSRPRSGSRRCARTRPGTPGWRRLR